MFALAHLPHRACAASQIGASKALGLKKVGAYAWRWGGMLNGWIGRVGDRGEPCGRHRAPARLDQSRRRLDRNHAPRRGVDLLW